MAFNQLLLPEGAVSFPRLLAFVSLIGVSAVIGCDCYFAGVDADPDARADSEPVIQCVGVVDAATGQSESPPVEDNAEAAQAEEAARADLMRD
jgi:hypothetical protein